MNELAQLLGLMQGGNPQQAQQQGLAQALMSLAGPSVPSAQPPPAAPGIGIDPRIEEQIRALSAPEPVTDIPVPNAPTTLQQVLAGLADAGGIYGRGLNPFVPIPGASGRLQEQGEMRRQAMAANEERRGAAKSKSKKTEAELRLRQLLGEQEGKARQLEKEEAGKAAARKEDVRVRERQEDIAREVEESEKQRKYEIRKEEIKSASDQAEARIREGIRQKDAYAKDQNDRLEAYLSNVDELANTIQQDLAVTSPDVIRKKLAKEMRKSRLGPDAEAIARQFIEEEIEPALHMAEYYAMEQEQSEVNKKKLADLERRQSEADRRGRLKNLAREPSGTMRDY